MSKESEHYISQLVVRNAELQCRLEAAEIERDAALREHERFGRCLDTLTVIDQLLGVYGTPVSAVDEITRLLTERDAALHQITALETELSKAQNMARHNYRCAVHEQLNASSHGVAPAKGYAPLVDDEYGAVVRRANALNDALRCIAKVQTAGALGPVVGWMQAVAREALEAKLAEAPIAAPAPQQEERPERRRGSAQGHDG